MSQVWARDRVKKRYLHAHQSVSSRYNPEAKRRGQVLKDYMARKPCATRISASVVKALLVMVIMQRRLSF